MYIINRLSLTIEYSRPRASIHYFPKCTFFQTMPEHDGPGTHVIEKDGYVEVSKGTAMVDGDGEQVEVVGRHRVKKGQKLYWSGGIKYEKYDIEGNNYD
jgi:hypothetical protein